MNLELIKSNRFDDLELFLTQVTVRFISFEKELVPIPKSEGKFSWIPLCNKLLIEVSNNSKLKIEDLLLTVFRTNSIIGEDNIDNVPIKTYGLLPELTGIYEIIVFDHFSEKFWGIELWVAGIEDWKLRLKAINWLNRAGDFSKRVDFS